jgi:hypothetical protein
MFANFWDDRLTLPDECDRYASLRRDPDLERDITSLNALEGRERLRASIFAGLAAKYRHAAAYPWLPVEPDPAPPE